MLKRVDRRWILVLIIILQVLMMVLLGTQKNSYFIDEVASYGLSNSYYEPFIQYRDDFELSEIDQDVFKEYLSVDSQDAFKYDSVFFNQSKDVHPPFYYVIFHTVSSVLQHNYSKWLGIGINLAVFIFIDIFLYAIVRMIHSEEAALCAVTIWGFSAAAINTVTFIRMYALLSLMVIVFIYLHKFLFNSKMKFSDMIPIMIMMILGSLTHYYFIIFAFFYCGFTCLYLLINKRFKELALYASLAISAVIIAIIIFPPMIDHIFASYRGEDSFAALDDGLLWFGRHFKIIDILFAYWPIALIAFSAFTFIVIYILYRLNKKYPLKFKAVISDKRFAFMMILTLTSVIYFVLIAKIAPFFTDRYIMVLFPISAIYGGLLVYCILGFVKSHFRLAAGMAICVLLSIGTWFLLPMQYLYIDSDIRLQLTDVYKDLPVVYIYSDLWQTSTYFSELAEHPSVVFVSKENISELDIAEFGYDEVIVYVEGDTDDDMIMAHFKDKDIDLLTDVRTRIYHLS